MPVTEGFVTNKQTVFQQIVKKSRDTDDDEMLRKVIKDVIFPWDLTN